MSETKFTPGPYGVDPDPAGEHGLYAGFDMGIGEHEPTRPMIRLAIMCPADVTPEQALANAALFATAPELYAAADAVIADARPNHADLADSLVSYELLCTLRAALARARGGE